MGLPVGLLTLAGQVEGMIYYKQHSWQFLGVWLNSLEGESLAFDLCKRKEIRQKELVGAGRQEITLMLKSDGVWKQKKKKLKEIVRVYV